MTGSDKRGHFVQKLKIGSRSKSSEKFFLSPIFVFCRISLSDPCSKSMPNFKCQKNLKDPKRAMERQATFYSLSFSKFNKWGSFKQVAKKTAAIYSLPLAESLPLHRVE